MRAESCTHAALPWHAGRPLLLVAGCTLLHVSEPPLCVAWGVRARLLFPTPRTRPHQTAHVRRRRARTDTHRQFEFGNKTAFTPHNPYAAESVLHELFLSSPHRTYDPEEVSWRLTVGSWWSGCRTSPLYTSWRLAERCGCSAACSKRGEGAIGTHTGRGWCGPSMT